MSLATTIAADGAIFVNTDEFGESVVVTPKGSMARTISVIVDREAIKPSEENPKLGGPALKITARNNAILGISSSETGLIGMTIAVALRIGEAASTFTVRESSILMHDSGIIQLGF
jgi:hypothetical protein